MVGDETENFQDMRPKLYSLHSANLLSASGLERWKLELHNWRWYVITCIKIFWICHTIHRYAKANEKYMKNFDENKDLSCIKYWDINNLHGKRLSQK